MNLRSGRIKEDHEIASRGFNVKGRAVWPDPRNVLVTSDPGKYVLAAKYGVNAVLVPSPVNVILENAYAWEIFLSIHVSEVLDKKVFVMTDEEVVPVLSGYGVNVFGVPMQPNPLTRYLLIGYGRDFLYYGLAASNMPLDMRGPRPNAAAPKNNAQWAKPEGDLLVREVEYTGRAVNGADTPPRDQAMGGTARNYAAAVIEQDWAYERQWEWLHVVGHALGGNNERRNLVAGTYDANTQMIPHERAILDATQVCPPVTARWEVNLHPESWLAIDITMTYSFIGPNGFTFVSQTFKAQTDISFDRLQYDISFCV